MFTKKDLKIGDWLVSRNGYWYQFLGNDIAVSRDNDGWCSLREINDNFKYCSDILGKDGRGLDIVKVVRPQEDWHYCYHHKDKGAVMYAENDFNEGSEILIKIFER